jgi:hypothetical protein
MILSEPGFMGLQDCQDFFFVILSDSEGSVRQLAYRQIDASLRSA